jgi:hypothetical protein
MDFLPSPRRPVPRNGAGSLGVSAGTALAPVHHVPAARWNERTMPTPRRRLFWKIVIAALVGIPWLPLAAAIYAWVG